LRSKATHVALERDPVALHRLVEARHEPRCLAHVVLGVLKVLVDAAQPFLLVHDSDCGIANVPYNTGSAHLPGNSVTACVILDRVPDALTVTALHKSYGAAVALAGSTCASPAPSLGAQTAAGNRTLTKDAAGS